MHVTNLQVPEYSQVIYKYELKLKNISKYNAFKENYRPNRYNVNSVDLRVAELLKKNLLTEQLIDMTGLTDHEGNDYIITLLTGTRLSKKIQEGLQAWMHGYFEPKVCTDLYEKEYHNLFLTLSDDFVATVHKVKKFPIPRLTDGPLGVGFANSFFYTCNSNTAAQWIKENIDASYLNCRKVLSFTSFSSWDKEEFIHKIGYINPLPAKFSDSKPIRINEINYMSPIISKTEQIFNIKILNKDGNKLAHLIPYCNEYQNKVKELQIARHTANPSTFLTSPVTQMFATCLMEVIKIQNIIKDSIIDIHYKMGLADKHTIVVAYDATNHLTQAIGILHLDREAINEKKCVELFSLITAIWNVNIPENDNHPNRVKGAGSSIIRFCQKLAKENEAKYIYLEAAPTAESFYEKHGFTRLSPKSSNSDGEALDLMARLPMILDLENIP